MKKERDGFQVNPNEQRFTTISYNTLLFNFDDLTTLARNMLRPDVRMVAIKVKQTSPMVITNERLDELRDAPEEDQERFVYETAVALRGAKRAIISIPEPNPMEKPQDTMLPVSSTITHFINNELPQIDSLQEPDDEKPTSNRIARHMTIMRPSRQEAEKIVAASAKNPHKTIVLFWGERHNMVAPQVVNPNEVKEFEGKKGIRKLADSMMGADGIVVVEYTKKYS